MSADISALGALAPAEALDLNTYKGMGAGRAFPKEGRTTLRAPESFPATAFGKTRAGNLSITLDPTIHGGEHDGFNLRFIRLSAKVFMRGGEKASQIGDYLSAVGYQGQVSGDPQEQADAVVSTANRTFDAILVWEAYGKGQNEDGTDYRLTGMTKFPSDGKGGYLPYVPSPTAKDPITGEPVMLRANLVVDRYIQAGK